MQKGAHAIAELVVGLGAPKAVELQKKKWSEEKWLLPSAAETCGAAVSELHEMLKCVREWIGGDMHHERLKASESGKHDVNGFSNLTTCAVFCFSASDAKLRVGLLLGTKCNHAGTRQGWLVAAPITNQAAQRWGRTCAWGRRGREREEKRPRVAGGVQGLLVLWLFTFFWVKCTQR